MNPIRKLFLALQGLWHAFRDKPLTQARDDHQQAVRAVYRSNAELEYHKQLATYFDGQARGMDPHGDWHYFAQLKDKWHEHVQEQELELRRFRQANAKADACLTRLRKLEGRIAGPSKGSSDDHSASEPAQSWAARRRSGPAASAV